MGTITKQDFIKKVWDKVNNFNVPIGDAILDTALLADIDVETAAKIISSNSTLKTLLEEESIELRTVRPKIVK